VTQTAQSYTRELQGVVALPALMNGTLLSFAQRLRVHLEEELSKPLPDNALVATLCDAARLGYEYQEGARRGTWREDARLADDWHEDFGPSLWWRLPVVEPPWCGTPLDSDWPMGQPGVPYYTHFTSLPEAPRG
jgi:hypothetical protein